MPGRTAWWCYVTNTLINYVSGLKEPPDVPAELQPRLGKANPAIYRNERLGPARNERNRPAALRADGPGADPRGSESDGKRELMAIHRRPSPQGST